ncbi:MAG: ABC transporter ATP-binding protein [Peptococcaceae bacterium]|jgi:oligopeptide transport system ATP-binding protein|nr:ABC transporter ATP-binding protein [Peptococcaceae bacterium]
MPKQQNDTTGNSAIANDIILKVADLRVSFRAYGGRVQAVRGISFDLKRGETVAIVGESGSGKSVSVKTVMGILPGNAIIESGEVRYGGMDLTKVSEEKFHEIRGNRIGLIFQDPLSALNPIMKIGKQITETLRLAKKMSGEEARAKAIELMAAVHIPDPQRRFNQYPFQFSGGMRQRIVIAIALAGDPEILICDEPTTALDVTVQSKILELINEIKRERHLSVIFITHDLGVVANMADRVNVMYAGKIVEAGTTEEIFFSPAHPYTWALLSSMPDLQTKERLQAIPGAPPNMIYPPAGDAFARRNPYALKIDMEKEPPYFRLSDTHYAATWLAHPKAPKVEMPAVLRARIDRMKRSGMLNG